MASCTTSCATNLSDGAWAYAAVLLPSPRRVFSM